MKMMTHLALAIATAGLLWNGSAISAEDGKPAPKADGEKVAPKPDGERRDRGREGERGMDARGGGGFDRGAWAQGLNLGGMGGRGNNVMSMVSRMLGIEIEDPKAPFKREELPLGAERRSVINVPVGGVDNPGGTGAGWKMESVFKLTEEQQKALEAVRAEYETDEKKLDAEIKEEMKKIAEKVKALRLKYELRANDVLAGEDKSAKEKMDALAKELHAKNTAVVKDVQPLFDLNDTQQGFSMIRMVREKTAVNLKDYETKLLELVPMASRETISEVVRRQTEMRDQMNRWMGGMGGRGGPEGGDRGRRDQEPVKPPRPPEADKKGEF